MERVGVAAGTDDRSRPACQPGELLTYEAAREMERQMLASAVSHDGDALPLAIWRTHQALIVPSGMPQAAGFSAAAQVSRDKGWPVYERDTGGDLTPQFDGILNVSMVFTLGERERNIASAYGRLIAPILQFLQDDLGIDAYAASVKGAFCDGAHNIVVDQRKLAGTAQRWRLVSSDATGSASTRVLGHIALVCGGPLDDALDAVNRFYEACGMDRAVVRQAHVRLCELAPRADTSPDVLAHRMARFVNDR